MLRKVTILCCAGLLFALLIVPNGSMAETQLTGVQNDRAQSLFSQLRCVVCQNQSILESDADVAKDLRSIVTEQIILGRSDSEIKTYLIDRYGEFILLRPVFEMHTAILWVAPALFVFIGAVLFWRATRKRTSNNDFDELNDEEKQRLNQLLKD